MKDIEIKATEDEKVTEKSWSVILSLFLHLEILRGGSGIPSKHMFHDADVRINIQRVSLIELVQLMLEAWPAGGSLLPRRRIQRTRKNSRASVL